MTNRTQTEIDKFLEILLTSDGKGIQTKGAKLEDLLALFSAMKESVQDEILLQIIQYTRKHP